MKFLTTNFFPMRNRFNQPNHHSDKKRLSAVSFLKKRATGFILLLSALLFSQLISAQCQLNCINGGIQVSLDETCTALITPNVLLKNPNDCPGLKIVEVLDQNNKVIPTNPVVTGAYIGQTLKVRIIHPASGNICWGFITIEDKLPPVFANCKDYTLPCAMPINQILAASAPTVSDNCNNNVKLTRTYTKTDLGCNSLPVVALITVNYVAEDIYGNKSGCLQYIYLERGPIIDVQFPLDYDDVALPSLNCKDANTNPSNTGFPSLSGFPLIAPDCGYLVSYVDLPQYFCPGQYKILRTWTVMDWCGGVPGMRTANQVIKVTDTTAPSINCNINVHSIQVQNTKSGPGYQGCTAQVKFPALQVSDDCSNYNQLTFLTYTYDAQGNIYSAPSNGGVLTLPLGDYFVYYDVTDGCGNKNSCYIYYELKDKVAPVVACESFFQVSLTDSLTLVNASTFDDGSYDECSSITYFARRMDNPGCAFNDETKFDTKVPFYCCDVNNGPVNIVFRAVDAAGNFNDCMVQVTVNDKIKPIVWCPKDITVQCGEDYSPKSASTYTKTVTPNTVISDVFAKAYTVPVEVTGLPAVGEIVDLNVDLNITHGYLDQLTIKLTSPKGTEITLFQGGQCGQLQTDINAIFDDEAAPLDCTGGNPAIFGSVKPLTGSLHNFDGENPNSINLGGTNKNWILTVIDNSPLAGGKINKVALNFTYATPLALKPKATDNTEKCGLEITWSDLDLPNNCQNNFVRRQWSASDKFGNKSSCIQRIYFIDNTPLDVIFPKDITIEDCISLQDLANLGAPIHNGDCELVAVDPQDQVFNVVPDACYKIQRTWTVLNWCKYDKNKPHTDLGIALPGSDLKFRDDGDGYFKYVQTIKIIDKVKPVLTAPANVVFGSYEPDCGPAYVQIDTLVWKDCTPNPVITYSIDFYNDGTINSVGNGANASAKYPNGTHKVSFKVSDKCGNFSIAEFTVTVKDAKKPTPICLPIAIPVMPNSGSISITPEMVSKGTIDNCTPANKITMTVSPSVFTCDDLGDNLYTLTVTDEAGNTEKCTNIVNIQDGSNVCSSNIMAPISGKIVDISNKGVGLASVASVLGGSSKATTNDNGDFTFKVASGGNYNVAPAKNINPLNGVSTQDILLITNHILGKKALDSPYKYVAADVTKDGKVTASDLVQIRRLILHIIDDFEKSQSWTFVDQNFKFPGSGNPLTLGFPNVYPMNNMPKTGATANFVGVKMGDVQGNATSTNVNGGSETRSSDAVHISTEIATLKAGETRTLTFKASDLKEIEGFQFTLLFDTDKLTFEGIQSGDVTSVTEDNFGTRFAGEGMITASWNTENARIEDGSIIFKVNVKAVKDVMLSDVLTISSTLTPAEAYTEDGEVQSLELQFTENGKIVASQGFELFQNRPNPFNGSTMIGFSLPEAAKASITIFDMSGRTLTVLEGSYAKGYNEVKISQAELGAAGVFYYRLDTPTHSGMKKMVIIE